MTTKSKKPDDDDTEWLPQAEVTLRTGCSASWVHAQGAKGTVRRRKSGTWKGRPVYAYAYADIVREADNDKLRAHQAARQAALLDAKAVPAPAVLGHDLPVQRRALFTAGNTLFGHQPALTVEQLRAALKVNVDLGIMTREDAARAALKLLALD